MKKLRFKNTEWGTQDQEHENKLELPPRPGDHSQLPCQSSTPTGHRCRDLAPSIPHSSSLICILLCLPHTQSNDKTGTPSKSLGAAAISIGDLSRVPGVYSSLDSCWKFGLAIRISLFWIPYTCCSREKQLQNGLLSFSDLCPYVS